MAIITNKMNLPKALVNFAEASQFDKKSNTFSVTTLLKSNREILLSKRYDHLIESDVSSLIWMLFGTAVHGVLEHNDDTGNAEQYLKYEIKDGYYLTGKADLYNEETLSLEDWKTASVYKVIKGDFYDWKLQGLMYIWLFRKMGIYLNKIKFHALLKDWSSSKARYDKSYPKCAVYTYEHEVLTSDIEMIEEFIYKRFDELIKILDVADDELPECTAEERWYSGDVFAVYKKGGKKALKLCSTLEEAEGYMQHKGGDLIEKRVGENRKCEDYCSVCNYCKFYKELKEKEEK